MIFVADMLCVHTAMMLSATQIGTVSLCSKKWSKVISKYFLQSVNKMKQNNEAWKVKVFQSKFYLFFCAVKIIFSVILIILYIAAIFPLQLTPCYLLLVCFNCSILITCGQLILKYFTGCVDRSLRIKNISEQNLSAKCEHSYRETRYKYMYMTIFLASQQMFFFFSLQVMVNICNSSIIVGRGVLTPLFY